MSTIMARDPVGIKGSLPEPTRGDILRKIIVVPIMKAKTKCREWCST